MASIHNVHGFDVGFCSRSTLNAKVNITFAAFQAPKEPNVESAAQDLKVTLEHVVESSESFVTNK